MPVAAIYGANASGKTAVIGALGFVAAAVKWSHAYWLPDTPFPAEPFAGDARTVPSEFTVDLLLGGIRYQYGFAANSQAILREWLYVYPKRTKQAWFERVEDAPISFGRKMPGENTRIGGLTRENSLFLSAAAQNNHEALLPIYNWFSRLFAPVYAGGRSLSVIDEAEDITALCKEEPDRAMITGCFPAPIWACPTCSWMKSPRVSAYPPPARGR